jgi:hypothetical protein
MELKAVGGIRDLEAIERQLRDYNKSITAMFCVITDGQHWRFYYSQTGGEFSKKCFKRVDLLRDEMDALEQTFRTFLGKEEVQSGKAETEAKALLQLSHKEKAMEECLPEAKRLTTRPPFPSLPEALVGLVEKQEFQVSREEAESFITAHPAEPLHAPPPVAPPMVTPSPVREREVSSPTETQRAEKVTMQDLVDAGLLQDGETLYLFYHQRIPQETAQVVARQNKLRYAKDGRLYSRSRLASKLLRQHGLIHNPSVQGPKHWVNHTDTTLDALNERVRDQNRK